MEERMKKPEHEQRAVAQDRREAVRSGREVAEVDFAREVAYVRYQRCGGGRRVIRRGIGPN